MPSRPIQERRSGPDFLIRVIKTLNIVCGSLMIAALLLIDKAKPGIATFFDRLLAVHLRKNWDRDLLLALLYVAAAICFLSLTGLLMNKMRTRRKTDRYSKTLIFSIIFSLAALIFSFVSLSH